LKLGRVLSFVGLALPAMAQYAGPAILSRGEAPAAMSAPEVQFRPFLELTGVYDTGLAGVVVNDQGSLANESSYGMRLGWGVSGAHSWRRTKLGISYGGSVSHYASSQGYDSIDQSLLLGLTHQISRHIILTLSESAGTFSRDMGMRGLQQSVPFDPSTTYTPATDYFDNRTYYLSSQASLKIQKSARLSFSMGGDMFITRRRSSALYGNTGVSGHGDVQYRLRRRVTVGAGYNFTHFTFTRVFGATDVHMATGSVGVALSQRTELSGYAGFYRAESQFIQQVPVDPAIAALLGITSGTRVDDTVLYGPAYGARLSHSFGKGVAYATVGHAITPGNGLFLTSQQTNAFAGYGYNGLRRWSLNAQVGYMTAQSVGTITGQYGSVTGGVSVSRTLLRTLHFIASSSVRQYQSGAFDKYNRRVYDVTVGLGWAPGDVPLRLW
jgi:hypothetical protein